MQESQQTMMDNLEDIYSLSLNQKGVLLHNLSSPESSDIYMTQMVAELSGDVDVNIFKQAWQLVINRHPMLRTAFMWEDLDDPLQVVFRKATLPVTEQDWTNFSAEDQNLNLEKFLLKDRQKGFLLSEAPLCRLTIFKQDKKKYLFVFTFHILLLDGWSKGVVFNEVLDFYNQLTAGQEVKLQPAQSFKRYIKWSVEKDFSAAEEYWRSKLKGYKSPIHIGRNGFTSKSVNLNFQEDSIDVEENIIKDLESFTRKNRLTINTIVQGTWALLLSHYTGQNDIVFGAAVSGRPPELPGTESIVGFMINTIPVRIKTPEHYSVLKWFKELQEEQNELRNFENVPLPEIRKWTELERSEKLFESVLLFENWPNVEVLSHFKNMKFCPLVRTMYPLTFCILPKDSTYTLYIAYESERFDAVTIHQILNDYKTVIQEIVNSSEITIDKLLPSVSNKDIFKSSGEKKSVLSDHPIVKPSTETEKTIAGICSELLGIEEISIEHNFFELGGHSLFAANLITQLNKIFHIELPLSKFFETPTIKGLSEFIDSKGGNGSVKKAEISELPKLVHDQQHRYEPFPLTDLQQGYWIGRRGSFGVGNVPSKVLLELEYENLDLKNLNDSWQKLIDRHDMLRFIVNEEGQGVILKNLPYYDFKVLDLRGKDTQTVRIHLSELRDKLFNDNKRTDQWPLFDIYAVLIDEIRTRVLYCLDQLFVDAGSVVQLFNELYSLYEDSQYELPEIEISFRDYVFGEIAFKNSELYKRSKEFWIKKLESIPPAPELPTVKTIQDAEIPRFVRRSAKLESESWEKIKLQASKIGVTSSGILITAFAEVLSLWCKSPIFTLNIPIFNRLPLHSSLNNVVGEFASFVLLEVDFSKADTFSNRAKIIQRQLWENLDQGYFSGISILRELAKIKGSSTAATMPVVFTSLIDLKYTQAIGKMGKLTHWITQTAQVWFDHHIIEEDGALIFNWDCLDELFPPGLLADMFDSYFRFLTRLATDKDSWEDDWNITASKLLPQSQVELRNKINDNSQSIPDKLLQNLFEEKVEEFKLKPAVITSKRTLKYGELELLANYWGNKIREFEVKPNSLVAIVMEKGWEQIVAVLGILKSGAAYVPIDPDVPKERLWYLLENSKADIILTQSWLEKSIQWPDGPVIWIIDSEQEPDVNIKSLKSVQKQDDLAFVIYTSGSTGLPKGAMLTHKGAVNAILQTIKQFNINSNDKVLALTALHHDMSLFDIFGMLSCGASLVIPDPATRRDPGHWSELMVKEQVTIWNSVPAMIEMLFEYAENNPCAVPESLRYVFLGGDWISLEIPSKLKSYVGDAQVVSVGGPTETTLWNIWYPVEKLDSSWKSIPYGKPIANTKYYVYNENLNECPTWVPGELCVTAVGVAKGYWMDESRTKEKFIIHPLTGERLYLTGDLGRYLPDGNIEIIGRKDFQIKIQGQRIELGEIEYTLKQHEAIKNAVVMVRGEANEKKYLVAYIIKEKDKNINDAGIISFLQDKLPSHMIPNVIMELDHLPFTSNGKIDRSGLPVPEKINAKNNQTSDYSENISRIVMLVSRVLGIENIDPQTNLISLGANSIDMVRIGNQLEKEFGKRPRIDQIFRMQTVDAISRFYEEEIEHEKVEGEASIIVSPYEQGLDNDEIKKIIDGFELQMDPDVRHAFRDSQPGLRHFEPGSSFIQLINPVDDEKLLEKYRMRRSYRDFALKPIAFEQFSNMLSCMRQVFLNGKPKYLYGSPGGLYPGQLYFHFKPGRVEGIKAGTYYYDPAYHRLIVLTENAEISREIHVPFINAPIFDEAAFSIYIVTDLNAIGPNYGKFSIYYSIVEAGLIAQLLEMEAPKYNIGLCQIGSQNFGKVRHLFKLQKNHVLIHSMLGGNIEGLNNLESWTPEPVHNQTDRTIKLLDKIDQLTEEEVKSLLEATKNSQNEKKS